MAYNPNETAEEFAKRVREQQGGKALGGKDDQIAPIPKKMAEAAVPLNRAGGESLAQGQGKEMTYGEAMTRAAQYGHVPSQIGGGQPFNQAGGGPATMDQLNAIKGIWGIPTENGWVELSQLPDVTAVEAWTRKPSAARAAGPRNAPGSWVQDPATWKPTTPGGRQIIPVDPEHVMTKGFQLRPTVNGQSTALGIPSFGGAAGGGQPQGMAARMAGGVPTQPSRASAGGPVVPRGMAGIVQQAQVQPGGTATGWNGMIPGTEGWNPPKSLQELFGWVMGQGATAQAAPATQGAPARLPYNQTEEYMMDRIRNTPHDPNNAIDIPIGHPRPSWERVPTIATGLNHLMNPPSVTDNTRYATTPTSLETQAGGFDQNWFTPGEQFQLSDADRARADLIRSGGSPPPQQTQSSSIPSWMMPQTAMSQGGLDRVAGQPAALPTQESIAQMHARNAAPANWSGGGDVQPWMLPPASQPSPYTMAPQTQAQVQAGSQSMTPANLPPWYNPNGQPQQPLTAADFATPQPLEDWGVRRGEPPMATVINITPGGGGGGQLPSYQSALPSYLNSAATFGRGLSQGAMNASAPLFDLGNPGGGGYPMGRTDYAPSSMNNRYYPYSPNWR